MSQITDILCTETLHWSFAWNPLSESPESICTESNRVNPQNPAIEWIPRIQPLHRVNPQNPAIEWIPRIQTLHWSVALNPLSELHWNLCTDLCIESIEWRNQMSREKSWKSHHRITAAEFSPGNFLLASHQQPQPLPSNHPLKLAKLKVGSFVKKTVEKSNAEFSLST